MSTTSIARVAPARGTRVARNVRGRVARRARAASFERDEEALRAPAAALSKRALLMAVTAAAALAGRSGGNAARAEGENASFEYTDVVVGKGADPIAGVDVVKVNYKLSLGDGATDSAKFVDSAKFFVFGVGTGEVVKGFDIALCGDGDKVTPMRVGGVRTIRIPAQFAYGSRGAGCDKAGQCTIPPDADLMFQIELLEVR